MGNSLFENENGNFAKPMLPLFFLSFYKYFKNNYKKVW